MVTAVGEKDRPQPWSKKSKLGGTTTRETRASAKAILGSDIEEDTINNPTPVGKRRGRKPKSADTGKGKQKTKSLPAATVNVVLGRGKNPVPDVEEMRKKSEEDAAACGRVMRKIIIPATRKTCPQKTPSAIIHTNIEETTPHRAFEGPSNPQDVLDAPISAGMILFLNCNVEPVAFDHQRPCACAS
jgi:hypothetical protein